jgi:hypothetical protein
MKLILTLIGILTVLGGLWPLLKSQSWIPSSLAGIPDTGMYYQGIIIAIGVIAIIVGIQSGRKAE